MPSNFAAKLARLFLLVLLAAPAARAQDTPEAANDRYVAALRALDYDALAALTHPSAHARMARYARFIASADSLAPVATMLFGAAPDEVRALPDAALFARTMRGVTQVQGLEAIYPHMTVESLGHVMAGDTAHVVGRMTVTLEGLTQRRMQVASFLRTDAGWQALLSGDLEGILAALEARLGAGR